MTENIKKLLELVSNNEELKNKLSSASKDDLIFLAKELGVTLTDADFESNGEISDDELNTVAGGKMCMCTLGGGGTGSSDQGNKTCACVGYGQGQMNDGTVRCSCPIAGGGVDNPN